MSFELNKKKAIRAAICERLAALYPDPIKAIFNSRILPLSKNFNEYPMVCVYCDDDAASDHPDARDLDRAYDVTIVLYVKGPDVSQVESAGDSVADDCDTIAKAIEVEFGNFMETLGGLIRRLKYDRTNTISNADSDRPMRIAVIEYTAFSDETLNES